MHFFLPFRFVNLEAEAVYNANRNAFAQSKVRREFIKAHTKLI